jgi:class 3 adenylate cyclase
VKQTVRFFSSIGCLVFLAAFGVPASGQAEVAKQTIDCIEISHGEPISLAGSWSFEWMENSPGVVWSEGAPESEILRIPSIWGETDQAGGSPWPHFGYGTYRLNLLFQGSCPLDLGIDFVSVRSSARASVVWPDGEVVELGHIGKFSKDSRKAIHQHRRTVFPIHKRAFNQAQLVVEIAKYDGGEGGLNRAPYVGELQALISRKQMDAQRHFFVLGILIFVAFYHLMLFFSRTTDRSSLYFALMCLIMFFRFFVVHGFIDLWFSEPHEWLYQLKVQLDYASYAIVLLVCYRYISTLFPDMMWEPWMRVMASIVICLVAATPFGGALAISSWFFYVHALFAATSVFALYALFRAVRAKKSGSKRLAAGFLLIMLTGVNDVFAGADVLTTPMLSPLGLIVFIFINARIIAERHSQALETAEHLTANLESEVLKKTRELEARTWEAEEAQDAAVTAQVKVEELNRDITENVLKRYLPPMLIDEILEGDRKMNDSPKHLDVTIIFTDLVGFTSLSEKIGTQTIARLLNEYFTAMGDVIFDNGGTIDKFIGDAIMVMFGAPVESTPKIQARQASATALGMMAQLRILNKKWNEEGLPSLSMRIGIHRGPALVGNLGSDRRIDYTAIGSTVNRASRIETACVPGCVFMSDEVASLLPSDMYIVAGDFDLKGFHEKVTLYQLKRSNIIELNVSNIKNSG